MLHALETGVAIGAGPHRVEEGEPQQIRNDPERQKHDEERQRDVERRGKQVFAHPADRTRHRYRRRLLLERLLADKVDFSNGEFAFGHRHGVTLTVPPA